MDVAPGVAGAHAAVCLVCVRSDAGSDLAVVVTRRSARLSTHRAQYALPGGRLDSGEGVVEAGLRELSEEMGVVLSADAVLGTLDDFVTRSGFRITPIVVWAADQPFAPAPSAAEVSEVYVVPVADLDVRPNFVTIPGVRPAGDPDADPRPPHPRAHRRDPVPVRGGRTARPRDPGRPVRTTAVRLAIGRPGDRFR
jgi:8-oxo-dGTP pyrophosphatase MutT (NUDIX family)